MTPRDRTPKLSVWQLKRRRQVLARYGLKIEPSQIEPSQWVLLKMQGDRNDCLDVSESLGDLIDRTFAGLGIRVPKRGPEPTGQKPVTSIRIHPHEREAVKGFLEELRKGK